MSRISREEMLLEVAAVIARRGTCLRLQVGAVIVRDGRIVSTGYNGSPVGLPHCSPATCNAAEPCTHASHAELNAITYAARAGVATHDCDMYCTDSPCLACARAIINAGIRSVHYSRRYRIIEGIELLQSVGIVCYEGSS